MEYQTGVKKKDTLEITELLNAKTGEAVKVNGAVHTIRDMGTVAFKIIQWSDCSHFFTDNDYTLFR